MYHCTLKLTYNLYFRELLVGSKRIRVHLLFFNSSVHTLVELTGGYHSKYSGKVSHVKKRRSQIRGGLDMKSVTEKVLRDLWRKTETCVKKVKDFTVMGS